YIGSPENLAREGLDHGKRRDFSTLLTEARDNRRLNADQTEALTWVASQPGAPTQLLVIAEEWSSDCRRHLPSFARIAETMRLALRIFRRDGRLFSESTAPSLAEAPDSNADLIAEFLKQTPDGSFQSIPVAAFLSDDLRVLYRYQEFPSVYEK